jgi:hypothetical protein
MSQNSSQTLAQERFNPLPLNTHKCNFVKEGSMKRDVKNKLALTWRSKHFFPDGQPRPYSRALGLSISMLGFSLFLRPASLANLKPVLACHYFFELPDNAFFSFSTFEPSFYLRLFA